MRSLLQVHLVSREYFPKQLAQKIQLICKRGECAIALNIPLLGRLVTKSISYHLDGVRAKTLLLSSQPVRYGVYGKSSQRCPQSYKVSGSAFCKKDI